MPAVVTVGFAGRISQRSRLRSLQCSKVMADGRLRICLMARDLFGPRERLPTQRCLFLWVKGGVGHCCIASCRRGWRDCRDHAISPLGLAQGLKALPRYRGRSGSNDLPVSVVVAFYGYESEIRYNGCGPHFLRCLCWR
jgi:hypothetical protein